MEIDPNNLGPLVYKEEQVITKEDLLCFIEDITELADELALQGKLDEDLNERVNLGIHLLETLLIWIEGNKKKDLSWFQEEDDDGYNEID